MEMGRERERPLVPIPAELNRVVRVELTEQKPGALDRP